MLRLAPQTVLKTVVTERLMVRCHHPPPLLSLTCGYGVMVAALRLERSGEIRGGSSPSTRTN